MVVIPMSAILKVILCLVAAVLAVKSNFFDDTMSHGVCIGIALHLIQRHNARWQLKVGTLSPNLKNDS